MLGCLVSAFPGEGGWTRVAPLHGGPGDRVACCYLEEGALGLVVAEVRGWALVVGPEGCWGWADREDLLVR